MTSMDKKKRIEERLEFVSNGLASKFEIVEVKGERYFHSKDNVFFKPFSVSGWDAIGIEYAHGIRDAVLNRFEDGDLFYLDEMDDEALLAAVLQEIKQ